MKTRTQIICSFLVVACLVPSLVAYCVYNDGCKKGHAELYNRNNGWFSDEFTKSIDAGKRECCNPSSSGCIRGSKDDTLLWIHCQYDDKNKKNNRQTVIACGDCDVRIRKNGMITVDEGGKTKGIYACAGVDKSFCD